MATQLKVQAPAGTQDVLPADAGKWTRLEAAARTSARLFNFRELRTPVFEHSELFHRAAGETTDIVRKETYTFEDRGGRSITLRPEGTAGAVRAVMEAGLLNDAGTRPKVFYLGPNFRYERPQSGRLRIHHQFGAEAFGVAEPGADAECILLQLDFYRRAGLKDLSLRINSLGDADSKQRFRDALVAHFSPHEASLSDDSRRRLSENPMRILDSKDPRDATVIASAPPSVASLSEASRAHFDAVAALLRSADVTFTIDPRLVRGFDYYTGTLWEVVAGGLGAQNAVGGGGRYDNLVEQFGGRPTPGVGFGCGLERLLLALDAQGVTFDETPTTFVWLITQGDAANAAKFGLLRRLRDAGIAADTDFTGRAMKAQFKLAEREAATHSMIVGDEETAAGTVQLKTMATREQQTLSIDEAIAALP